MTTNAASIRTLFLEPKPTYPLPEAAAILGMDEREVRGWIESGELEADDSDAGLVVPWSELVSFGMDFWSQEAVEEALGEDLLKALPELVQLDELRVRVPRFEIAGVRQLAERESTSVDAVVRRELLDLVSSESEYLSATIAGFAEAFAWPEAG